MTLWTGASIVMLAAIFWLNAVIIATPYIAYLLGTGFENVSSRKKRVATGLLLFLISTLYFFIKVGSFADEGVAGIVDPMYIRFIWEGPVGQFVQFQTLVAALWIIYSVVTLPFIKWGIYSLTIVLMSWSFLSIGHGSDAAWWGKAVLLLHLLVAWLWFGSLNLLRKLTTFDSVAGIKKVMERFGLHMSFAVPILLTAGFVMYRSATGQWLPQLPMTAYDVALLTKLAVVALILSVAALHKLKFVPQLNNEQAAKRLKKSITMEMVLAATIFIAASALSSAFSPS